MLFKPIYNLEHLEYLNKKNLSNHQNLDHLFNIIEDIKHELRWDYVSINANAIDVLYANIDKIEYSDLCFNKNPRAIQLIEANLDKVNIRYLSSNQNAVPILLKNIDQIDWNEFSRNPASEAVDMLLLNPDKIDWKEFSGNPNINAINYLRQHPYKINWKMLCWNENPEILSIIRVNIEKLDGQCWDALEENYNHIDFLREHKKENWSLISQFSQDIEYIRSNLDKVDWSSLSQNPNMIPILLENRYKIDYLWLSLNENPLATDIIKERIKNGKFNEYWDFMSGSESRIDIIFPLYYEAMSVKMREFDEELCGYVFNPKRLERLSNKYGVELEQWQEIY